MAFLNAQELVAYARAYNYYNLVGMAHELERHRWRSDPSVAKRCLTLEDYVGNYSNNRNVRITEAQAQLIVDAVAVCLAAGKLPFGKWIRPWDATDVILPEDKDKWVFGVEVESGFAYENRRAVAGKFLNSVRWATADIEGPGRYPLEASFAPLSFSKLVSEQSPVIQYLNVIDKIRVPHGPDSMTGTHISFSTPESRINRDTINIRAINNMSQVCLHYLDREDQKTLFGRRPYGGLYPHSGGSVEMKLFNTTTDVNQFRRYARVTRHIARNVVENRNHADMLDSLRRLASRLRATPLVKVGDRVIGTPARQAAAA